MTEVPNYATAFSLKGKVALVTGGSRGIGFYTAQAFLLAGCDRVYLVSRKVEGPFGLKQAEDALAKLPGIQGKAISIPADLSKFNEIKRVAELVEKNEGSRGLNIAIANSGTSWGGPFDTTPDESSGKVLDLNVRGVFSLIQQLAPLLQKAGTPHDPSRVVIVGSTGGIKVAWGGDNGVFIYAASKAAAHHLARNLAVELGPRNITVNAIAPGFFPTKLANGLIENLGGLDKFNKANPRGRTGEPLDIGGTMLFLCSPAGNYINGVVIPIDGGAHLGAPPDSSPAKL